MLKLKSLINMLWIMTVLFCLHPCDNSIAGDCDKNRGSIGTPTVTGNYIYPPSHICTEDPDLEYDTVSSHETIDRNGSATLFVIGNNAPYIWSVSGTGFTLETEGEPTGSNNTLYADGTACGAATITVTGCDGQEVIGYVRCTAGSWVIVSACDGLLPPPCSAWNCSATGIIIGKNRYDVIWTACNHRTDPDCCNSPTITSCGHCPDGDAFVEYCQNCTPASVHFCDLDICFSKYLKTYVWQCN